MWVELWLHTISIKLVAKVGINEGTRAAGQSRVGLMDYTYVSEKTCQQAAGDASDSVAGKHIQVII